MSLADFTAAIERIVAGLEKKSRILNPAERRRVAYHEMGHALVAASLPGVDPVHKVSIIPRGVGALGYTMQRPTEDRFLLAKSDLENRIAVLLGGRAAEALIFDGDFSTGAADDLQRATEIAWRWSTRHGMDETLGTVIYEPPRAAFLTGPTLEQPWFERNYSEETSRKIDAAVRDAVAAAFVTASRDSPRTARRSRTRRPGVAAKGDADGTRARRTDRQRPKGRQSARCLGRSGASRCARPAVNGWRQALERVKGIEPSS